MSMFLTRRRLIASLAGAAVVGPLLQACQPQTVEVTKIVEKEKPVEVTKVVEKAVEVTKVVEKQVEKKVEVVVTATAAPKKLQAVSLTIAGAPTDKSWAKALEIINQPQITWKVVPGAEYEKLKVQFAAGTGPDVFLMNVPSGKFWMAKGVMQSLEPWKKSNPQYAKDIEGMVPSTVTSHSFNGELRGTPFSAETTLGYYNKDYFAKVGVEMPAADKYDWNTQLEMFKKLTQGTGKDMTYATMVNGHTQSGSAEFIYAAGAKIMEDDGLSTNCASPEMIEAVKWMVDLIYKEKVSAEPTSFAADSGLNYWSALSNWKTVYANTGEWAWAIIRDQQLKDKPYKIGYTEPPKHPKTGKRGAQNHTLCLGLYNKTKYPDEAATVITTYAQKPVQELIAPGWLPARIDAQDAFFAGVGGDEIKGPVKATQSYSQPYPSSALEEGAVNVFWTHLTKIWQKQEEVEAGLKAAQKEITDAISKAATGR